MNSIIRQVCRNVKRWRNAKIGLRWTAAGMLEAKKGFRRLKAHKHLPVLKAALQNHRNGQSATPGVLAQSENVPLMVMNREGFGDGVWSVDDERWRA